MRGAVLALLAALLATPALSAPLSMGRMTFENFVSDASDGVAGIYFSKVCEPGVFDGSRAAYAVIGCIYPVRQAVDAGRAGDLVIPAYLDGVPVRRVNAGAFTACTRLTSVTFPPTLREVGPNAFAWCTSLTNVTFLGGPGGEGVEVVWGQAFTNCTALKTVTFPPSLRRLGREPFVLCDDLESVTFLGNAPELDAPLPLPANAYDAKSYLGEKRYAGSQMRPRAKLYVRTGTYGWRGPYRSGLPEKWPVQHGWATAHDVVPLPADAGGTVVRIVER